MGFDLLDSVITSFWKGRIKTRTIVIDPSERPNLNR